MVEQPVDVEPAGQNVAGEGPAEEPEAVTDDTTVHDDDVELVEITVSKDAPVAGKTLEAVALPRGAVVVADKTGGPFPGPDTVLDPGGQYVLAVKAGVTDGVVRLLRG